jgi:hypothetical protein
VENMKKDKFRMAKASNYVGHIYMAARTLSLLFVRMVHER